jgi:hypothetical protein
MCTLNNFLKGWCRGCTKSHACVRAPTYLLLGYTLWTEFLDANNIPYKITEEDAILKNKKRYGHNGMITITHFYFLKHYNREKFIYTGDK